MQSPSRRPFTPSRALGLTLLVAAGLHAGGAVQQAAHPDAQRELLADLEAFEAERSAFRRLLPGEQGMTATAVSAYYQALFEASEEWVRRWPHREFAWRARLEALLGLTDPAPDAARHAALRGLETTGGPGNIVYPEPLELLAARALVRHRVELPLARELVQRALVNKLAFLDRLQESRPGESFVDRRRRWRWRTALVRVEAAEAERDPAGWRDALEELESSAAPEPCKPEANPLGADSCEASSSADRRQAAVEYAVGQVELRRRRARLFSAVDRKAEALSQLLRAVELRPAFRSRIEPPANRAALEEARAAWLAAGLSQEDWETWLERRKGYPIPIAMR